MPFVLPAMAFEHKSLSHFELTLSTLVMVPLAYVAVGLLGLPVYLWLKKRQRLTGWSFTGWGVGAGMILFWLLDAAMILFGNDLGTSWSFHGFLVGTAWSAVVGFTVAATFALIAGIS